MSVEVNTQLTYDLIAIRHMFGNKLEEDGFTSSGSWSLLTQKLENKHSQWFLTIYPRGQWGNLDLDE